MKIRWKGSDSAAVNASARLPELTRDYFAMGRDLASREDPVAQDLHGFRLATKRLRYTLELFRDCYGPGLEDRLDELRSIQTFLGDNHDCAVARQLIDSLLPSRNDGRQKIDHFLVDRAKAKATGFREHWLTVFDAPGREQAWVDYLSRYARRRS